MVSVAQMRPPFGPSRHDNKWLSQCALKTKKLRSRSAEKERETAWSHSRRTQTPGHVAATRSAKKAQGEEPSCSRPQNTPSKLMNRLLGTDDTKKFFSKTRLAVLKHARCQPKALNAVLSPGRVGLPTLGRTGSDQRRPFKTYELVNKMDKPSSCQTRLTWFHANFSVGGSAMKE